MPPTRDQLLARRRTRQPAPRRGAEDRVRRVGDAYAAEIERIISAVEAEWMPRIESALATHPDVRTDAIGGDAISALLRGLRRAMEMDLGGHRLSDAIERHAARVDELSARELAAMLRIEVPELGGTLERDWVARNEHLTRDLTRTYVQGVERVLREAPVGVRAESLIRDIAERADVTRSRARVIAVNETLTLYSTTTRRRQQDLGIRQYRWSASRDQRVRPWHARLNRTIQSWDDPPVGGGTSAGSRGHPGDGILCRCTATPILETAVAPGRVPEVRTSPTPPRLGAPLPAAPAAPAPSAAAEARRIAAAQAEVRRAQEAAAREARAAELRVAAEVEAERARAVASYQARLAAEREAEVAAQLRGMPPERQRELRRLLARRVQEEAEDAAADLAAGAASPVGRQVDRVAELVLPRVAPSRSLDSFRGAYAGLSAGQRQAVALGQVPPANGVTPFPPVRIAAELDRAGRVVAADLIDGNHRLAAAREAGVTEVMAVVLDNDQVPHLVRLPLDR